LAKHHPRQPFTHLCAIHEKKKKKIEWPNLAKIPQESFYSPLKNKAEDYIYSKANKFSLMY